MIGVTNPREDRESTVRPRSLRNMGRGLSNEIRPRKMKVNVSGKNDEGVWVGACKPGKQRWVSGSGGRVRG